MPTCRPVYTVQFASSSRNLTYIGEQLHFPGYMTINVYLFNFFVSSTLLKHTWHTVSPKAQDLIIFVNCYTPTDLVQLGRVEDADAWIQVLQLKDVCPVQHLHTNLLKIEESSRTNLLS